MSEEQEKENRKNQEYVEKNLDKLRNLFMDKYVVIFNQEMVGSFTTFQEASEFGVWKYGIDKAFLIYHMETKKPLNFVFTAKPTTHSPVWHLA
jgi:hypothetical protein